MVHMPLLERVWLAPIGVPFVHLGLWAFIGIVAHLLALEALHQADVLASETVVAVPVVVASIAMTIVVATVMHVAVTIVAIPPWWLHTFPPW